jgi:hypothetical protein
MKKTELKNVIKKLIRESLLKESQLTSFNNEKLIFSRNGESLVQVDDARPANKGKRMYVAVTKDGFRTDYPLSNGKRVTWDNPEMFSSQFRKQAEMAILNTPVSSNGSEHSHSPEMRVRSDEPTSPYAVDEHYGDDDYEDEMRANDTTHEKVKGTVAYSDKSTGQTYEYDYMGTVEFYKGEYHSFELDNMEKVWDESPDFESLSPAIQQQLTLAAKKDAKGQV